MDKTSYSIICNVFETSAAAFLARKVLSSNLAVGSSASRRKKLKVDTSFGSPFSTTFRKFESPSVWTNQVQTMRGFFSMC
jgi:hypothetical protein